MNALSGQGFAHSEIGQSVICRELKFHDRVVIPYDNGDGKIWFTADTLAGLLGYADKDKVLNLFYRHEDEFSPSMTTVAKMRVNGINNSLREIDTRLFSPRGAHLIGMFARTKVAKELRVWLLDLVEKEGQILSLAFITRLNRCGILLQRPGRLQTRILPMPAAVFVSARMICQSWLMRKNWWMKLVRFHLC